MAFLPHQERGDSSGPEEGAGWRNCGSYSGHWWHSLLGALLVPLGLIMPSAGSCLSILLCGWPHSVYMWLKNQGGTNARMPLAARSWSYTDKKSLVGPCFVLMATVLLCPSSQLPMASLLGSSRPIIALLLGITFTVRPACSGLQLDSG